MGSLGTRRKQTLDDLRGTKRAVEIERGSTTSHCCAELALEEAVDLM